MSQNVASTSGADTLVGSGNVFGLEGNDCILGSAELDALFGNEGNDSLLGDAGNDSLDGGKDNDATVGNAGADLEIGGAGADTLFGNQDNDTLYGGLVADNSETSSNVLVGGFGNDLLFATAGDEMLFGNQDDDEIHAGGGTDTVFGGKGNDTLNGDAGDDLLIGGEGSNAVHGGSGVDHAVWAGSASGVYDAALGAVIVTHDGGTDTVYNDVEQLVIGGVERSFDSFVPGAVVVDTDILIGDWPTTDKKANGDAFVGSGTPGDPLNGMRILVNQNTNTHFSLQEHPRQIGDTFRPVHSEFDGTTATFDYEIPSGFQTVPSPSNRAPDNVFTLVGTDNGVTLQQAYDAGVRFHRIIDLDPSAGRATLFELDLELVGGVPTWRDHTTNTAFITDDSFDANTAANSWNRTFAPGNDALLVAAGSDFLDEMWSDNVNTGVEYGRIINHIALI